MSALWDIDKYHSLYIQQTQSNRLSSSLADASPSSAESTACGTLAALRLGSYCLTPVSSLCGMLSESTKSLGRWTGSNLSSSAANDIKIASSVRIVRDPCPGTVFTYSWNSRLGSSTVNFSSFSNADSRPCKPPYTIRA